MGLCNPLLVLLGTANLMSPIYMHDAWGPDPETTRQERTTMLVLLSQGIVYLQLTAVGIDAFATVFRR